MNYKSITPAQLDERMKRGDELRLIDVRELEEYEVASVEGAELLPLSQFSEWAGTLDPAEEIVVISTLPPDFHCPKRDSGNYAL